MKVMLLGQGDTGEDIKADEIRRRICWALSRFDPHLSQVTAQKEPWTDA